MGAGMTKVAHKKQTPLLTSDACLYYTTNPTKNQARPMLFARKYSK